MLVSLTQFNIKRPERLNYDFLLPNPDNLIKNIKSKSLRSFLIESDEILAKNNINYKYEDLTEEKFIAWLPYYKEKMEEHNYDVRAKKNWYQEQINKGFIMKAIFMYQNKKLVGSGIFDFHNHIADFAYKASDRITISSKKAASLGSIIEFLFLKKSAESGSYKIATNRSRNAFGFFNTLGYLDLKLRFGYKPRPSKDAPLLEEVPVNEKGFVIFYGLQDDQFILFSLQPESTKGQRFFDKTPFIDQEIPFKEIYY
ncbi:hypothetical protein A2917_02865 [Candidatus Nomurabacteria bacterium RIFCSPLOWO2_01_FULL_42_17]|uniref:Uncharacterized protein n=1 Tax=Candidatus Nomurabacteria bacterium RIFCSPLOWO2_01_FULL_42_17 TaxID=1801780 RepID=A0A1F6XMZ0_9BACT|nr:MAG: hypothetical protein A2917_02865 [Candidatus Nomurabacteria bacterium RIFCSPLOWO2_01_FULL_42_17]